MHIPSKITIGDEVIIEECKDGKLSYRVAIVTGITATAYLYTGDRYHETKWRKKDGYKVGHSRSLKDQWLRLHVPTPGLRALVEACQRPPAVPWWK